MNAESCPTPEFFFFDLGNVLVTFDHAIACRQMAELANVSPEKVHEVLWKEDRVSRLETGQLATQEMYHLFCQETGSSPDATRLAHAAADIFQLNQKMTPLLQRLSTLGHRMGILSNTSQVHWDFVMDGRYPSLCGPFEQFLLSFEVGAMKPNRRIFDAACAAAQLPANKIFFVDDLADNVAGARKAGLDAVLFTNAEQLRDDLRRRGVDV